MNYQNDPNIVELYPVNRKKKNKSKKIKTFGSLLLVGAISGTCGMGGSMIYDNYFTSSTAPQILYTSAPLEALTMSNTGAGTISLPDLYTMNVGATVGLTVSTTLNIFGQPTTSAATGSGFVISSDGYIVTNYHVIEGAVTNTDNPIEVKFQNGDSYTAEIIGFESDSDLAILKVEATDLQSVIIGDSDALVVGETVVAIGNPLGELDFSFTDGIISAKDRLITMGDDVTMNMLQTNTAINPGNSGGPLFNGQGALIGINTAKYAKSSDGTNVEGLGFAIPINDVKNMILDIIENGYVTGKPYLGVGVSSVPQDAIMYGIVAGASIISVAEGGAAANAGIQVGDIITAIDDVAIDSHSALTAAMINYRAGDSAVFTVVRKQEEMKLTLIFDEKNEETETNNPLPTQTESNQNYGNGNSGNGNSGNSGNGNSFSFDDFGFNFPFNFFP